MMRSNFISTLAGVVFGLGLTVSEMINPARVIGFLDVTGDWDPTLALVMGAALSVTLVSFPLILKKHKPIYADSFSLPSKTRIDMKLMTGAALFGVGWGIAGLCPGPAVAALVSGSSDVALFVAAMVLGYVVTNYLEKGGADPARLTSDQSGDQL